MGEGPRGAGASTVSGGTAVEPRGGFAELCGRASGLGLGPAECVHTPVETYSVFSLSDVSKPQ